MFKDRKNITGEYKLLSNYYGVLGMLEDLFGKIFKCEVKAWAVDDEVRLFIHRSDIEFRGNNADGIFEDDVKRLIVWKQNQETFDVVIGPNNRSHSDFKSVAKVFGENVESREWSEEEIHEWKRKNRK